MLPQAQMNYVVALVLLCAASTISAASVTRSSQDDKRMAIKDGYKGLLQSLDSKSAAIRRSLGQKQADLILQSIKDESDFMAGDVDGAAIATQFSSSNNLETVLRMLVDESDMMKPAYGTYPPHHDMYPPAYGPNPPPYPMMHMPSRDMPSHDMPSHDMPSLDMPSLFRNRPPTDMEKSPLPQPELELPATPRRNQPPRPAAL